MTLRGGDICLPRTGVPVSLVSDPSGFGGTERGDLLCGTLVVREGAVIGLVANGQDTPPERLVLPRFAEAHVHLDKCHTVDRCAGIGGDLGSALEAQRRDKARWTQQDLATRAERGLRELEAAGCGAVRSHVDWSCADGEPERPLAWDVLGVLQDQAASRGVILQRSALTGVDEMADITQAERVARHAAEASGALGGFVLDQKHRAAGIRNLMACADRFGLPLDFHVDEGLDPALDGLELIADIALELGHKGPMLCGHACSLASRTEEDVARIADKLALAGIAVVSLPSTNLYLQGRTTGTPDRRGLTRLHELAQRGVDIVIATDNVRDAFCPIGKHDPVHSLSLAVLAGHLDPPFGRHLTTITTAARRAMGLPALTVDKARVTDLLAVPGASLSDLIAGAVSPVPFSDVVESHNA